MKEIISCKNMSKSFGGTQALDNVSLTLKGGEIHALVGENGAGKSTFIKILSGVYQKDSGDIKFCGESVDINSVEKSKKLGIAVIYQELSVIKALNATENVFIGNEILKSKFIIDTRKMVEKTKQLFKELGVNVPINIPVRQLSISQCQLIEIAKALREKAKVLILDEPTTSLTNEEVEKLFKILRNLKDSGTAILYVSHRLEEIYKISDKVTVFRDGKSVGSSPTKDIPPGKIIEWMVNRQIDKMYPKKESKPGNVILEIKNLNLKGKLFNINLKVHQGELLGIGGLIGSGRTELVEVIDGVNRKTSGKILLNGNEVNFKHPKEAIKNGIVMVPEDRSRTGLILKFSVLNNITLPTISKYIKFLQIIRKKESLAAESIIKKMSIKTAGIHALINSLSGGNQQKISIGKWLLVENIKLFILDEPTRGVDVGTKYAIYQLIGNILESGAAIIMVSSDLPELISMSDRIVVIKDGKINGELLKEQISEENVMKIATGSQ